MLVDGERDVGRPVRLRAVLLPLRPAAARPRAGPVLLPAEDGEPPRGAAVERRVRARAGPRSASRTGTIRATVLIETYPGRVRDGGDPLRAARALGRAERRALGLHVQRDQELPRPGARDFLLPDRNSRDDDRAVHAGLHRAAGAHLPQARRARHRRDGGVHPEQGRGGQRAGVREGARRQDPRGRRRLRRLVGRAPRHGRRSARRSSTSVLGDRPEPASTSMRDDVDGDAPSSCSTSRPRPGEVTEAGLRSNISVGHPVPRRLAARVPARSASTT